MAVDENLVKDGPVLLEGNPIAQNTQGLIVDPTLAITPTSGFTALYYVSGANIDGNLRRTLEVNVTSCESVIQLAEQGPLIINLTNSTTIDVTRLFRSNPSCLTYDL